MSKNINKIEIKLSSDINENWFAGKYRFLITSKKMINGFQYQKLNGNCLAL